MRIRKFIFKNIPCISKIVSKITFWKCHFENFVCEITSQKSRSENSEKLVSKSLRNTQSKIHFSDGQNGHLII